MKPTAIGTAIIILVLESVLLVGLLEGTFCDVGSLREEDAARFSSELFCDADTLRKEDAVPLSSFEVPNVVGVVIGSPKNEQSEYPRNEVNARCASTWTIELLESDRLR